jgi:hypothetical protein
MFDKDLIKMLDAEVRIQVEDALVTIANSGLIATQKQRLLERVAAGADTESEPEMLAALRDYRIKVRGLDSLNELGEYLNKEPGNA